jgi:2-polyprenyl-3-methyl-5-hydroxy-6-metoxy-1,4-benzoquinol methylase
MTETSKSDVSNKVAVWWSDPQSEAPGTQWVEVPGVKESVNRRATGDPAIDWIDHSASLLAGFKKPINVLSVGCGFGAIERLLRRREYCQHVHGVDIADAAIETARKTAEAERLEGLSYEVADLNTVIFPKEKYDAVYAHASLHHVFQLEHLLDQIKRTLKPDGLFFVQEYVGPSQMQFPQDHLYLADVFLKAIPERYRRTRDGRVKQQAARLPLHMMNDSDPSEAIRASEIVPLVASRFEIKHFRYIGGTLLLLLFNQIAGNFEAGDHEIMPLVNALIALDNFLIDRKVLPSYHVYMVCENTANPLPMQTHNFLPPAASMFPAESLEALTVKPPAMGIITAEPNPFRPDSLGVGETTVSWMSYGASNVEIRVDAPDGLLFARTGPGRFSQATGPWVRGGTTFYLQNVSDNLPLDAKNTIATVTLSSM